MASVEVGFQLCGLEDVVLIAEMARDYIEAGLGWSWTPRRIARQVLARDVNILKAVLDQKIAGFAIMYFGDENAHLNLLAVTPDLRGRGIGRGLVEWLEETARVAGIMRIYLEVRTGNNGAIAFYRRMGYRTLGLLPNYYRGREPATRMIHELTTSFHT